MTHAERVASEKAAYIAYRERAIAASQNTNVRVPVGASVLVCEDGAFVEAMLWVPAAAKVCKAAITTAAEGAAILCGAAYVDNRCPIGHKE